MQTRIDECEGRTRQNRKTSLENEKKVKGMMRHIPKIESLEQSIGQLDPIIVEVRSLRQDLESLQSNSDRGIKMLE